MKRLLSVEERDSLLARTVTSVLEAVIKDIIHLPSLPQSDSSATVALFTPLLSLEDLFPRNRINEFIPSWPRYKFVPQLLELPSNGISTLWRSGRLRSVGWDANDVIEIVERRFGRGAEELVREIRMY